MVVGGRCKHLRMPLPVSNGRSTEDLLKRMTCLRNLTSNAGTAEPKLHSKGGESVGNILSKVMTTITRLNSPTTSNAAEEKERIEETRKIKERYGRNSRQSFLRSNSSTKLEEEDDISISAPYISGSDDYLESLCTTSLLPKLRRNSFIFGEYPASRDEMSKEGLG